ncbi:MAG TPA: hypothetical protein VJN18_34565 [Polyangiaceae bacterium]|nr:hypothetical protein [Polyangiaceae bacterium]
MGSGDSAAGLGGASVTGPSSAAAAGGGGAAAGEAGSAGEGAAVAGGGAASEDGSAGEGGSPGRGRPDGCLDFSHFEYGPRMTWDLRVIGTGFEADEGSRVRVVVTNTGEPSYALAEATIHSGSFDVALPGIIEPYTGIGVYFDKGRDDACDVDGDTLFTRTTGGVYGDYVWEITPDEPDPAGASPCYINGIFDLTTPLPCPE